MMMMIFLQVAEVSADYVKWLTIFVGILATAILLIALAVGFMAVKIVNILNDVKNSFDETKGKAMPLIAKVTDITHTVQGVVADMAPKIKVVSDDAVEMSHTVRQTIAKLDVTIRDAAEKASVTFTDADAKTKAQVARVNGMVSSTLAATAELGATVNEGIRVPARKLAAMVTQSRHLMDTLLDRAKALGFNVTPGSPDSQKTTKRGW